MMLFPEWHIFSCSGKRQHKPTQCSAKETIHFSIERSLFLNPPFVCQEATFGGNLIGASKKVMESTHDDNLKESFPNAPQACRHL